jgi:hypothetical protein
LLRAFCAGRVAGIDFSDVIFKRWQLANLFSLFAVERGALGGCRLG